MDRERSATSLEAEVGNDQQCVHVRIRTTGQDNELAVLLDALDIVVSDTERASLTGLAGFRRHNVAYIVADDHPCPG